METKGRDILLFWNSIQHQSMQFSFVLRRDTLLGNEYKYDQIISKQTWQLRSAQKGSCSSKKLYSSCINPTIYVKLPSAEACQAAHE